MSLWTPGGEHPVDRDRDASDQGGTPSGGGPDILAGLSEEQRAEFDRLSPEDQEQAKLMIAQVAESRRQMLQTPAAVVIANHAMGLYELAAIHLSQSPPNLAEAGLAVDGLEALVTTLEGRLGDHEQTLRQALSQLQMAFVELRRRAADETAGGEGAPGGPEGAEG